jgi:aspartyl-tRNA(Asn)/glutamyl-tRNA(Gln) amidotransferase subunit A
MKVPRRTFLQFAGSAAVVSAGAATPVVAPAPLHAQALAPIRPRPARDRLEEALARIGDPNGEGARACLTVYSEAAKSAADAADVRAHAGISLGPLDGAIVSIKDLFDVAGEPTRAGSKILAEEAKPAVEDAVVVRRLRAAGAVIVAKNNMTEFALSPVGPNPHYGTPGNPADRTRVPGGSSSGASVAVADRMCEVAIGSDTGGSIRIPAALCGVVGFKPSKYRVPTEGAYPLSFTLDSIGPLARTVTQCADADAILAGEKPQPLKSVPHEGLKLAVVEGLPLTSLDETVAARFKEALSTLDKANVRLSPQPLHLLDDMLRANANGAILPIEALAINGDLLARRANDIEPGTRAVLERAKSRSGADYVRVAHARGELVRLMDAWMEDFDGIVMPTTPIVAPKIADVVTLEPFVRATQTVIRNTSIVNFFDLCAVSLPIPRNGGLPVGLMVIARNGQDRRLLRMAAAIERVFNA